MTQFLSEIQEKYTKIVKNANLIGFLNRLVFPSILTDSQPLDNILKKVAKNSRDFRTRVYISIFRK